MKLFTSASLVLGAFALTLGSFSATAQVGQGSGEVKFTGSVIQAPCTIAPGSEYQEIPVGQVATKVLAAGGTGPIANFEISLSDCDLTNGATPYTKVQVSFTGIPNATNADVLINSLGAAGATNVGVELLNGVNQPIKLSDKVEIPLAGGSNKIKLGARIVKAGSGDATPGNVEATTTWTLNYI